MSNKAPVLTWPFILLVKAYQKCISPMLPGVCRFNPSCSQYMIEALTTHGVIKGLYLGTKRILRCHPWGGSGDDPVPSKSKTCQGGKNKVKDSRLKNKED